jgi:hypothetical protein
VRLGDKMSSLRGDVQHLGDNCPKGPASHGVSSVSRQLPIACTVAHTFARMQQPQADHLTGPEVGIGMFGDGMQLPVFCAMKGSIHRG